MAFFKNAAGRMCIGGVAVYLAGRDSYCFDVARECLDLTREQARELFYPGLWPDDLSDEYWSKGSRSETPKIAVKVIDRFIEKYAVKE